MINNYSPQSSDTNSSGAGSRRKVAAKWMSGIGRAEGVSFLLLLLVAMPLKYIGDNPVLVRWLGPVHGGLFLLYIASAVAVARTLNWRWVHVLLAFVASVIPFGPFVFEAWLHREAATRASSSSEPSG